MASRHQATPSSLKQKTMVLSSSRQRLAFPYSLRIGRNSRLVGTTPTRIRCWMPVCLLWNLHVLMFSLSWLKSVVFRFYASPLNIFAPLGHLLFPFSISVCSSFFTAEGVFQVVSVCVLNNDYQQWCTVRRDHFFVSPAARSEDRKHSEKRTQTHISLQLLWALRGWHMSSCWIWTSDHVGWRYRSSRCW